MWRLRWVQVEENLWLHRKGGACVQRLYWKNETRHSKAYVVYVKGSFNIPTSYATLSLAIARAELERDTTISGSVLVASESERKKTITSKAKARKKAVAALQKENRD